MKLWEIVKLSISNMENNPQRIYIFPILHYQTDSQDLVSDGGIIWNSKIEKLQKRIKNIKCRDFRFGTRILLCYYLVPQIIEKESDVNATL